MTVEVLEKDKLNLTIKVEGYPLDLVNGLRRYAMSEVPTLAIEDVVFIENSSLVYDESLAQRLGLVPLKTPKKYLDMEDAQLMLVLDASAEDSVRTVYSGDLVPVEDKEVKPVSNEIPILKLAPKQNIKLEAYARLGKGKKHSKYSPTSKAIVKPTPVINIKNPKTENAKKIVDSCPRNVFEITDGNLIAKNPYSCTYCEECLKVDKESLEITEKPGSYIFGVESIGQLEAKDIVIESANLIIKDLDEIEKRLDSL
ncbi:MAG: DNA-directed RNA polymerase subunit D [Nitrososphaeria archaeon]|nr:DNA-directed RNA polymerase subunit D [Conexivisphaerales archaeon]